MKNKLTTQQWKDLFLTMLRNNLTSEKGAKYVMDKWNIQIASSTIRMKARVEGIPLLSRSKYNLEAIQTMWNNGVPPTAIKKHTGISLSYLYILANKKGWTKIRHTNKKVELEQAKEMWEQGMNVHQIAAVFKVKPHYIYNLRNKHQWAKRPQGRKKVRS